MPPTKRPRLSRWPGSNRSLRRPIKNSDAGGVPHASTAARIERRAQSCRTSEPPARSTASRAAPGVRPRRPRHHHLAAGEGEAQARDTTRPSCGRAPRTAAQPHPARWLPAPRERTPDCTRSVPSVRAWPCASWIAARSSGSAAWASIPQCPSSAMNRATCSFYAGGKTFEHRGSRITDAFAHRQQNGRLQLRLGHRQHDRPQLGCAAPRRERHLGRLRQRMEPEGRRRDQSQRSQRADRHLRQIETRHVFHDFAAAAHQRAVGAHDLYADDQDRAANRSARAAGRNRPWRSIRRSLPGRRGAGRMPSADGAAPASPAARRASARFHRDDQVVRRILDHAVEVGRT